MKYYPIFLDLKGRPVTVIGGGEVALRKVQDLIASGALVTVIAPEAHPELERMASGKANPIIIRRNYCHGDLDGAALAFSATDDGEINSAVYREAEERRIFINAADDPENCSFIIPSSFSRGDLAVAVSTGGASPAMAAKLRRLLESSLPDDIGDLLEALQEARNLLKNHPPFRDLGAANRGEVLKAIVASDEHLVELARCRREGTLREFLKKIYDTLLQGDL